MYIPALAGFVTYQLAANQAKGGLMSNVQVRISVFHDSLCLIMQTSGDCSKHTLQLNISLNSFSSACSGDVVTFTVKDCN